MSQANALLELLKAKWRDNPSDPYMFSYQLIKVNTPYGFIGTEGIRRAQELSKSGILKQIREGKYVKFAYNPDFYLEPKVEGRGGGFAPMFK